MNATQADILRALKYAARAYQRNVNGQLDNDPGYAEVSRQNADRWRDAVLHWSVRLATLTTAPETQP